MTTPIHTSKSKPKLKYKQNTLGKLADPLGIAGLNAGGFNILDPLGITGALFGGAKKPEQTELLNYEYGNVGRLREKAAASRAYLDSDESAGLKAKKRASMEKKYVKMQTRGTNSEGKALKYAQKLDQKAMIKGPSSFADLEARRAAYQEKIDNPPPKGQVRTILRSL